MTHATSVCTNKRLVVPIFLHGGILHYAGNMMIQMSLGAQVESAAGWLRMMLIYLISGMGGNLFSAVFSPDVPSVGCSGALCGTWGTVHTGPPPSSCLGRRIP